jgi:hypothetical protein
LAEAWDRGVLLFGEKVCLDSMTVIACCRNGFPRYKLILRNQTDSSEGDFKQGIDADIRVEVKGETVFYQYDKFCEHYIDF